MAPDAHCAGCFGNREPVSSAGSCDRWLFRRAARPAPRLRLFCVPFAGCGASAFNAWPSAFPESVELLAIQLPGRESRYGTVALTDAHEAARLLADAIERYLDLDYAFFGYSMGALIAFEVIRELRRQGAPMPVQLFAAARRAPQLAATRPPLAHLPREAFLRQLCDYYYECPPPAWQNPELLEIILPVLRADMALCESYVYCHEPPFAFPIQAFAGQRDESAPLSAVQAWRDQTTGAFDLEVFEGGHFFINSSLSRLQHDLISRLGALMREQCSRS
jgi:medium-chain acyl-[acyl-carrier-protein] hydrolase